MSPRTECASPDDRWRLVDERVVGEGFHHEKGEVHASRQIACKDGITDVATPHGQTLGLALFEIAAPHNGPLAVTREDPAARFHLIIDLDGTQETGQNGNSADPRPELPGIPVLPVAADVPAARKDQPSVGCCVVEDGLSGPGRVLLHTPGREDGEYSVAAVDCLPDDFPVIGETGENRYSVGEISKFVHAAFAANADYFVVAVQSVFHHVAPQFSRCPDYADFVDAAHAPSFPTRSTYTVSHATLTT